MKVKSFVALTLTSALVIFAVMGVAMAFAQTEDPCYPIPAEGCEPTETPTPTPTPTPDCDELIEQFVAGEISADELPAECFVDCEQLEQAVANGAEGAEELFQERCVETEELAETETETETEAPGPETGVLAEGGIFASGLAVIALLSVAGGGLLLTGARRGRRR